MSKRLASPTDATIRPKRSKSPASARSISVHDDERPAEVFLRLKGADCSSELIGLYDVIVRLMSFALQRDLRAEKLGDLLSRAQCAAAVSIFKSIPGNFHEENR
jgi:hypothetical protein